MIGLVQPPRRRREREHRERDHHGFTPEVVGVSHEVLRAISLGAVFMGANTYIGNGPNFMVRAIAEERGVGMPSFGGYMLYSGAILIPLFVLVTLVFFR